MGEPAPNRGSPRVGDLLARVVADAERVAGAEGRALLGRLAAALAASARTAGAGAVLGGRWLVDVLLDVAPRIPVRDLDTLVAQHGGRTGEDLADALVRSASRATAGIGAATGGLAAASWAAPPTLLSAPVVLAAETLAIAAVEVKLVAELHEVYGAPVAGTGNQRAAAYLQAWAERRGVDPWRPGSVKAVLGGAARHRIRRQLTARVGRSLTSFGPLLTGAVAGGIVNRAGTRKLADAVRADLRRRVTAPVLPGPSAGPTPFTSA